VRTTAIDVQRSYYAETAYQYDHLHVRDDDEHGFALNFMIAAAEYLDVQSVLDIGCGTGRALIRIGEKSPGITARGIEPSAELRAIGHAKGLPQDQLIDGDATNLHFNDASFDLVCEFAVLHHVANPAKAVSEMLRVARKAIFISDSNNFGHGNKLSRVLKQTIHDAGLWRLASLIKTKGRGYSISKGDGLAYSYSVFDNYRQIAKSCQSIHMLNTSGAGPNLYRTSSHVAMLGIKRPLSSSNT